MVRWVLFVYLTHPSGETATTITYSRLFAQNQLTYAQSCSKMDFISILAF